jgi:hypothetical protein
MYNDFSDDEYIEEAMKYILSLKDGSIIEMAVHSAIRIKLREMIHLGKMKEIEKNLG